MKQQYICGTGSEETDSLCIRQVVHYSNIRNEKYAERSLIKVSSNCCESSFFFFTSTKFLKKNICIISLTEVKQQIRSVKTDIFFHIL
jgi:hypothetical protein